jgi:hypothetical protein
LIFLHFHRAIVCLCESSLFTILDIVCWHLTLSYMCN